MSNASFYMYGVDMHAWSCLLRIVLSAWPAAPPATRAALTLDDQANSLDDLDHNHFHERVRVVVQLLLHSSTFATC